MGAALLYLAVGVGLLLAAHRWVGPPLSRWAAGVLLALPLLFTGRALLTGRVYGPLDLAYSAPPLRPYNGAFGIPAFAHNGALSDVFCLLTPWQEAVRRALRQGEWPLWNPSILSGDVLAATALPAPYHPLQLAGLLVPLPASAAYLASAVLFFTGLAMFLFMRDLGCRPTAALVGAAGWMYCDFLAFFLLWPQGLTVAVLPLVLLGVRRVVAQPGPRAVFLLATGLALSLLAGHPESTAHVVGIGVVWGVAELALHRRPRRLAGLVAAGVAGLLALSICALQLLPFADALLQSGEYAFRSDQYATGDRSLPLPEVGDRLLQSVMPFVHGRPGWGTEERARVGLEPAGGYAGSLLLPLAGYGLLASRWRGRWLLLTLGVLAVLTAASAPGVSDLLSQIPPYDIAVNERLAFLGAFAVAGLAALGAEALAAGGDVRRGRRAFLYGFLVCAGLVALLLPRIGAALEPALLVRHLGLYLAPPLVALCMLGRSKWRGALPVLVWLLAAQRVGEAGAIYPVYRQRAFYPQVAPLTALTRGGEPYRVVGLGYTLIPNLSTMWGLEDPRGYQALTFARLNATHLLWSERLPVWFNLVSRLDRPFLSFLNVRYALARRGDVTPSDWPVVAVARNMKLIENPRVLARAFVPPRVRRGGTSSRVLREMRHETDFGQRAWIEVPGERLGPIRGHANGPGRVHTIRDGSGYRLEVEMERRGYVVTSITAWRGWRATVAGRELPLAFANHAFVAFELPAGRHEVRLRYLPVSFVWGRAITISSLAILTLAGAVAGVRGRRRPPSPAAAVE